VCRQEREHAQNKDAKSRSGPDYGPMLFSHSVVLARVTARQTGSPFSSQVYLPASVSWATR
jgi:hypothetical protein